MAAASFAFASVATLSRALEAREVSAVELAEDAIARIERHDPKINSICVQDFDRALDAARAADAALKRGESKPLLGVPITVKESFNVAGLPTTWGFEPQKGFTPAEDALAIARVKQAGAVILGKTNVPVGLGDWQSYNPIYGTTNNPYDVTRTPGGSSGGSSAALAAGFGALSLGSDIGGSLRAPAHFCGVYAHKPTFALCPLRGHTPPPLPALPFDRDMSVIGPMARSAADLTLSLGVMAGPDPLEAGVAYALALPEPRHRTIKDFRVLVIETHPLMPPSAEVRAAIADLAARLEKAGAKVSRDATLMPDLAASSRLYMRLLMSFLGATFAPEIYSATQDIVRDLDPANDSLQAERMRGIVLSHRDWVIADGNRARLRAAWRDLFKSFDVVLCPIMPTQAFVQDQSEPQEMRRLTIDGVEHVYPDQLVWPGVATLPGLPATAIPLTLAKGGLPIGAQLVGPWLEDRTPLMLAELIEREWGGFVAPKGYD